MFAARYLEFALHRSFARTLAGRRLGHTLGFNSAIACRLSDFCLRTPVKVAPTLHPSSHVSAFHLARVSYPLGAGYISMGAYEEALMSERIRDVMTTDPVVLQADASIKDAAAVMKRRDIGDVLVADGDELLGVVTDRDLVVRVLARGMIDARLGDICSRRLIALAPDDPIQSAVAAMSEAAVRRLAVVEDGRLVGMVSIGDLAQDRDRNSALAEISAAPPNS
jgi:CBS domain-containing protein